MTDLDTLLRTMPDADESSRAAVRGRAAQALRPSGALARLDEVAALVAAWQRTEAPAVERPACLVFGGDHGVVAAGVSAYPAEVTMAMKAAIEQHKATICAMGRAAGVPVRLIDVGIGQPTADFRFEAALSVERFGQIVDVAVEAVNQLDADVLVLGELGIGNTTAAAAVSAAVVGGEPADWVGRGAGVDDDGLTRKRDAVYAACGRISDLRHPLEQLRQVGGAELVAMAAATVAARHRRLPVLLDGFVTTAAVAPLAAVAGGALDHCIAGHCSAEPGHQRLLDHLGLEPLLRLEMRLGEASGAMAALPLVRMACAAVVEVPTFGEWFG
jgi:nicotinate-nucleotide--dimethylbenzimidazole phosphoribosyltransferase